MNTTNTYYDSTRLSWVTLADDEGFVGSETYTVEIRHNNNSVNLGCFTFRNDC